MTQEQFNEIIVPISWIDSKDHNQVIMIKAAVARTMRLCMRYPDLAKNYYDALPKATMDDTAVVIE